MITSLHIRNFTIVDEAELDLGRGLTVLTGETGAGKSILVDALGLALGERADSSVVRAGCDRAEIGVTVDVAGLPPVVAWLEAQSLAREDECILRRVIGADGRSRAYINDRPVSVAALKELGRQLVDIHGQQSHQSLAQPAVQRQLLDYHGGLLDQARAVAEAHRAWRRARLEHAEANERLVQRAERREMLLYQLGELDALAPGPGEYEELCREHERHTHSGRLLEGAEQALSALYEGDHAAQTALARTGKMLEQLRTLDAGLEAACEAVRQSEIQAVEAAEQLRGYLDSLELDPERAAWLAERLETMRELARKHRVDPDQLARLRSEMGAGLAELEAGEAQLERLAAQSQETEAAYRKRAEALYEARRRAAGAFGLAVTEAMRTLGLGDGFLQVDVSRLADEAATRDQGLDEVSFLVCTNRGQAPGPLGRVASGGELSRISLAIQVVAARGSAIPCMVFDEVDSGVGGGVAEIVGRRLRELGRHRQVLCVTHLPQVASQGHHHLRVHKETDGESTRTVITPLAGAHKVEELSRMLGGVEITERTRAHAEEMLAGVGDD